MFADLCLAVSLALLPQGQAGTEDPRPILDYPRDPQVMALAPFVDPLGTPLPRSFLAAGVADLDGDRNPDAWFLGSEGGGRSQLGVQLARTSSLGRFRDGHVFAASRAAHAVTFRSASFTRDRVLLCDPGNPYLTSAYYYLQLPNDPPRSGAWALNTYAFQVGAGAFEVATRADASDGHDDVAVLRDLGDGRREIRKLSVGAAMIVAGEVAVQLPFPLDSLALLDVDADGRADALARVPGAGVAVLRDRGDGTFGWFAFVAASGIESLFVCDANADGRDDVGLVLAGGVALYTSGAAGLQPFVALAAHAFTALRAAAWLDANADGIDDVIGIGADGRSVLEWFGSAGGGFAAAEVRVPYDPFAYAGAGPRGVCCAFADLDNDGDDDLLLQMPSAAHWHALVNPGTRPLAPEGLDTWNLGAVGETGYVKQRVRVRMPPWVAQQGLSVIEVGVYLEDPIVLPSRFLYWGRLLLTLDPQTNSAEGFVYFQTDQNLLVEMVQRKEWNRFADGITAGGYTLLTIHAKQGPQRFGAKIFVHDGSGDGHKSAKGVLWQSRAAPPRPSMDTELLPWD
jgi:hypothetical protein